jgi:hypothetical protein
MGKNMFLPIVRTQAGELFKLSYEEINVNERSKKFNIFSLFGRAE